MNLKRQAFIGSIWSLLSNGGRQAIAFVLFLFIARHIGPADIGLIALVMIVIDIVGYISRFGQIEALQRQPDLDDRLTSTSFWMLAVAGPLTTLLVVAGAELFGGIAGPDFRHVLLVLAPLCALQAWNAIPQALLKRRFDYRALAARTWLATLVGGAFGVYLAVNGAGVYALVAQRLASSVVQTVTLWAMLRWHPKMMFDRTAAKDLVRTGGGILLANLSSIINKRLVDAITGAVLGLTQLGHFRLGWRFFDFIVQFSVTPLTAVALSTFSTIQTNRERLTRAYLRLTQFVALASLPMFFGLGAIADLLVPVVLGDKWSNSVFVIQMLGFVMLGGIVNYFFAPVLIAVGKVNVVVRQSAAQIFGTAVLVFIGAQFGIAGVLLAIIARALMVAVYNISALRTEIGLSIAALFQSLMPPVVASGIMVAAVRFGMLELAGSMPDLVLLGVLVTVGVLTYGATLLAGDLLGLWRGYIKGVFSSLGGAITRRRASPTMAGA